MAGSIRSLRCLEAFNIPFLSNIFHNTLSPADRGHRESKSLCRTSYMFVPTVFVDSGEVSALDIGSRDTCEEAEFLLSCRTLILEE